MVLTIVQNATDRLFVRQVSYLQSTSYLRMERLRQAIYRPYGARSHPRYACFTRAVVANPLHHDFDRHVHRTREALHRLEQQRLQGTCLHGVEQAYYNREWFVKMCGGFDGLVNKVSEFVGLELNRTDYNRYMVLMAILEIVCSLILFCDSDYYRSLSDEDLKWQLFPLSKWSRSVVTKLEVRGNDLVITSNFL